MKALTIKKWKRDALETRFDWANKGGPIGILIRKLTNQVAELAFELESMQKSINREIKSAG